MDARLEQIRRNLIEASASLDRTYPYAPPELRHQIDAAWARYNKLVEYKDASRPKPGKKKSEFGQILIIGAIAASVVALMGGSAYIAKELNESDRLKKLTQCIENATKSGVPLTKAQQNCNNLYGGKKPAPLLSVGGLDMTSIAMLDIIYPL